MEVATKLLISGSKPISECVCMACDSLLMTCLLQVVDRFFASILLKLVFQKLAKSCFDKL